MNTDLEAVKVQALGNWFSFNAGQIKNMDDKIAHFIATEKKYMGLVTLPDVCIEDPNGAESLSAKELAIQQGRLSIVNHLKYIIRNLEVSLQKDLDKANIKGNVMAYASDGELAAYHKMSKFKDLEQDALQKRIDEVTKLKEKIGGDINTTDPRQTS